MIFEIAVKLFKVLSSHRSSIKKHFEPSTVKIVGTVRYEKLKLSNYIICFSNMAAVNRNVSK